MKPQSTTFSREQIAFFYVLYACKEPVPLAAAAIMAGIKAESLRDFLDHCQKLGWISRTEDNHISLSQKLPEIIRRELELKITPEHITLMLDRFDRRGMKKSLKNNLKARLLADSGRIAEAAELEVDIAHGFLAQNDYDAAYQHLFRAVEHLHNFIDGGGKHKERLFVVSVLELSSLTFAVGRGMSELAFFLTFAIELTERVGNKRAHAMACLHMGRLLSFLDKHSEALEMLSMGKQEVESLGDNDILTAAAEFLGLYYLHTDDYNNAIYHFTIAEHKFTLENNHLAVYPMILWHLGITLFATGYVPHALGLLHSYWRLAKDMGWPAVALIARAILGLLLAVIQRKEDARIHLEASYDDSSKNNNPFSLFITRAGFAIQAYNNGNLKESYIILQKAISESSHESFAQGLCSVFLIDIIAEIHFQGLEPLASGWDFEELIEQYLSEETPALKGIALRLSAEKKLRNGADALAVMEDAVIARECIEKSGAMFFLKDVIITMVRLHLREGAHAEARRAVGSIWDMIRLRPKLAGWHFLPDDIKSLLEEMRLSHNNINREQLFNERFFSMLHELGAAEDEEVLIYGAIYRLLRFLGAERGALFFREENEKGVRLVYKAGANLTKRESESESFVLSMSLIDQAFRENRIMALRPNSPDYYSTGAHIKGLLIVPLKVGGELLGAAYFENSFVLDTFDSFSPEFMQDAADHLVEYVLHLLECIRLREKTSRLSSYENIKLETHVDNAILTQSTTMLNVLDQAERAAASEASLLVTGETGTGKELLVGRLHKLSPRSSGPFIVVDSTTIPENLVESELFGHEKGAFTGADRRKRGRIELAHEGTLFIDEIGELPLQVQAKLLRALESKTFYRVGGTQPVNSDFRLVAATNRSLSDEVEAGRFRQDLFYRLNVIPLDLPPLRDRDDDIILLARHFLRLYSEKYGFPKLEISREDEKYLEAYSWPGNVRELKNVIERAVVLSGGENPAIDLPMAKTGGGKSIFSDTPTIEELQRRYIEHVLEKTKGRIDGPDGAAAILGLKRSTLYSRMYKLGLK